MLRAHLSLIIVWLRSGQWSEFESEPWSEDGLIRMPSVWKVWSETLCVWKVWSEVTWVWKVWSGLISVLIRDYFGLKSLIRQKFGSGPQPGKLYPLLRFLHIQICVPDLFHSNNIIILQSKTYIKRIRLYNLKSFPFLKIAAITK